MIKDRVVFVLLFCACSGGYAIEEHELSSLVFEPHAISDYLLPIEPSASVRLDGRSNEGDRARPDVSPDRLSAAIEERWQSISEEETLNGLRSSALIDEFAVLAALYQQLGDHSAASAALERAIEISRINDGLYSLDQVELVEQLIASTDALGDRSQSAQLQGYVLELTQRNPSDPRVASVLAAIADRQMDEVERILDGGVPSELTYSRDLQPTLSGFGVQSINMGRLAQSTLRAARRLYGNAIYVAVVTSAFEIPELLELEDKMVQTFYYEVTSSDLPKSRFGSRPRERLYGPGANVLQTKLINSRNHRRTPTAVATAMVELADWQLLFSFNGAALDKYRAAYDFAIAASVPTESIDEMFSPEIPAAIPAFSADSGGSDRELHYRGYIDVSFKITRYGRSKNVEILDRSPNTAAAIERRLKRHIAQARFRPRFVDGELARSDSHAVRYYFDY